MKKFFRLLGTLEVVENGKPSPLMNSPQGCALIAYLLITRQSHSREHLADLLWDAESTAQSLLKLRKLLYRIRPHLPELQTTRQQVAIQLDGVSMIDLHRLDTALASDRLNLLEELLPLYTNDLLAGFYLNQSSIFNEWLTIEREKLRQRVWDGYRKLCTAYIDQKTWRKGILASEKWQTLDPLDEETMRYRLRFLAAEGQLKAAINEFELFHQRLMQEMGVEPEAATLELVAQIQASVQLAHTDEHDTLAQTLARREHWGEAPQVVSFVGRQTEFSQLERWLTDPAHSANLITLLGIGGQGKTTLAAHAARSHADRFASVYWRSLINGPPLEAVLAEYVDFLTHNRTILPDGVPAQLAELRRILHQERHLLILDNMETFLDGQHAGHFRDEYTGYEDLLQLWGAGGHASTLLVTSREAPLLLNRLEKQPVKVVTLALDGLSNSEGAQLLVTGKSETSAAIAQSITQRYSGNPLALQLAAQIIEEFYFGNFEEFLADEAPIFEDVRHLINTQFRRLTPLEQEVLMWLAITREVTKPNMLAELIAQPIMRKELFDAMQKLQRRSLLQREAAGFTLQTVVMEYLTDRLITQAVAEVSSGQFDYLGKYALMLANAKEYVRQSQVRIIIRPIQQKLAALFQSSGTFVEQVKQMLEHLRLTTSNGYGAGNLLNLLLQTENEVSGLDFSELLVQQSFLQGMRLKGINFEGANMSNAVFTDRFGQSFSLAISPNGKYLAAGMRKGEIRVWRLADREPHLVIPAHTDTIWEIVFSPKSQLLLSCAADGQIYGWNIETSVRVKTLSGHTDLVWSVGVTPDEKTVVSAGNDGTLRFWDFETGRCDAVLEEETNILKEIVFSGDGRFLATFSKNVPIRIWDVEKRELNENLSNLFESIVVDAAAFSPDGQMLACGGINQEANLQLWDLEKGAVAHDFKGDFERMLEVIFSPDGKLIACASYDKMIRIWDVATGEAQSVMRGHAASPLNIAFTPDGMSLASSGYDQRIYLWEVQSGRIRAALHGHTAMIRRVKFNHLGSQLASACTNGEVHLWPIDSAELLKKDEMPQPDPATFFAGDDAGSSKLAIFDPQDETLIVGSDDPNIRLWNIESGRQINEVPGHNGDVFMGEIDQTGRMLATCDWGLNQVILWEWPSCKMLGSYLLDQGHAHELHFLPDGDTLMIANEDHTVSFWHIPNLIGLPPQTKIGYDIQPFYQLVGHEMLVFSAANSPDGRFVVSGSGDETVRLWDISDLDTHSPSKNKAENSSCSMRIQKEHKLFKGHVGWVWSVAFHPSGMMVASAGEDKVIRLWDVKTGELIRTFEGHQLWVYSIDFSPDGRLLASASGDETFRMWEVETGECLAVWRTPGPYEGMNIKAIEGVSAARKAALMSLGAIEK